MKIYPIHREAIIRFFDKLKTNQFHCGVDTLKSMEQTIRYIENKHLDKNFSSDQLLAKIKHALSAIVCTNYEESIRFNQLFDDNFATVQINETKKRYDQIIFPIFNNILRAFKVNNKKITNRILFGLFCSLIAVGIWYFTRPNYCALIQVQSKSDVFKKVGDQISIDEFISLESKDTTDYTIKSFLHIHNISNDFFDGYFAVEKIGRDTLTIVTHPRHCTCRKDTIFRFPHIFVGPQNHAYIGPQKDKDININEFNTYKYIADTSFNHEYAWYVDGESKPEWKNKNELKIQFENEGGQTIEVRYDLSKDSLLKNFSDLYTLSYSQQVVKDQLLDINVSQDPITPIISYHFNPLYLIVFVFLLFAFLMYGLYWYWKKRNIDPENYKFEKPEGEDENSDGIKGPFDIPFTGESSLIQPSIEIKDIGKYLRNSAFIDGGIFNVKETIKATIKNNGFIAPTYTERIVKSKYIILIDKKFHNSQPFHLFVYLINQLLDPSLDVEIYYFYQIPKYLYAADDDQNAIAIDQMVEASSDAKLFIFTSGHSLLSFTQPMVKAEYQALFSNWKEKIIITPVPYLDWSNNEKWLGEAFKLVPADLKGLLHIIHLLTNEEEDKSNLFQQPYLETYSSKYTDFSSIEELKAYMGDEDLFQWMCALAVYPKIDWYLTIEIGRVVLGNNRHKINYTNLLKFSRVRWMHDGKFTATDRFMLLKPLTVRNELVTRATILKLIDKLTLDVKSMAYQEAQVAKYINGFVLKASGHEGKAIYENIYDSQSINKNYDWFIYHQQRSHFMDIAFDNYIERRGEGTWDTPIQDIDSHKNSNTKNITLTEYMDQASGLRKKTVNHPYYQNILKAIGYLLVFLVLFQSVNINKEALYAITFNETIGLIERQITPAEKAYLTIKTNAACTDFITSTFPLITISNKGKEIFALDSLNRQMWLDSGWVKIEMDKVLLKNNTLAWGNKNTLNVTFKKQKDDTDKNSINLNQQGNESYVSEAFTLSKFKNCSIAVSGKRCLKIKLLYYDNDTIADVIQQQLSDIYSIEKIKQRKPIKDFIISTGSLGDGSVDSLAKLLYAITSFKPTIIRSDSMKSNISILIPDKIKPQLIFDILYAPSEKILAQEIRSYLLKLNYNTVLLSSDAIINESFVTYSDYTLKAAADKVNNIINRKFKKVFKVIYVINAKAFFPMIRSTIGTSRNLGKSNTQPKRNIGQTITISVGPIDECRLEDMIISVTKTKHNDIEFSVKPVYNKFACLLEGKYLYTILDRNKRPLGNTIPIPFSLSEFSNSKTITISKDWELKKIYRIGVLDFSTKDVLFTSDTFSIQQSVADIAPSISNIKISTDKSIYNEDDEIKITISYDSIGDITNMSQELTIQTRDKNIYKNDKITLASGNPFHYKVELADLFKRNVALNKSNINNELLTIKLAINSNEFLHVVEVNNKNVRLIEKLADSDKDTLTLGYYIISVGSKLAFDVPDFENILGEYNGEYINIELVHYTSDKKLKTRIYKFLQDKLKEYKVPNRQITINQRDEFNNRNTRLSDDYKAAILVQFIVDNK